MVEKSPTVSVIIPTYNREHLVRQAIQSVLAQTFSDFELILVDDASEDKTQAVVEDFGDSRIRYIQHEQNAGVCAARNTGLEAARGEYVAFLDSDDEWLPEKLEKQLNRFQESGPQVGVIYSWLCIVNEHNQVKQVRKPQERGFIFENLLYANIIGTPSTLMAKRECFCNGLSFDTRLRSCEDWDVWLQLAQHYEFDFVPEPLVQYRDHSEVNRGSTNSNVVTEGHLIFLKKHHQDIKKTFKRLGSFSPQTKAAHFFNIGRRLICHGSIVSNAEALEVGRQYLALAFLAYPLNIHFFLHYVTSLLGGDAYAKMNSIENHLRMFASRVKAKRKHSSTVEV